MTDELDLQFNNKQSNFLEVMNFAWFILHTINVIANIWATISLLASSCTKCRHGKIAFFYLEILPLLYRPLS